MAAYYYTAGISAAGWTTTVDSHTCSSTCCTCGARVVWDAVTVVSNDEVWGRSVSAAAQWFDVFRTFAKPLMRDLGRAASARRRILLHVSAAERRRQKRKQWLRAMYAL